MKVGIEGHRDLERDTTSMAVINKDSSGRRAVIARRKAASLKDQEIEILKTQLAELRTLVLQLVNKETS